MRLDHVVCAEHDEMRGRVARSADEFDDTHGEGDGMFYLLLVEILGVLAVDNHILRALGAIRSLRTGTHGLW